MRVSNVTVRKRLLITLFIGIFIFSIFAVRLGYVQFFENGWLSQKALDSWSQEIEYKAERGDILDRNGEVLATNKSRPSVLVAPKQVRKPAKTAAKLADILGMSQKEVYEIITDEANKKWIKPEGQKISNEKATKIKRLKLPGVFIAEDFTRHYPHKSYLSHVLGFAGIDNQGLTGLEAYYNDRLKGDSGHVDFYSDAQGNRMSSLKEQYVPPKDGLNLKLTIDSKVQSIVERELDIADQKYHPDNAIAIAMDPDNGEILAMSSRPDFNPEDYQNVKPEVYNHNSPIWRTYEPGSTFKIITLSAILNEGLIDLQEDHFNDTGAIEVAGSKLHCWKSGGHGEQTYLEVVQNSCNPGFVKMGQKLGTDKLFSYIHDFGFGKKTGIDLQGEAKGILFDPKKAGPLETATTAFGQGVSVTPIQQITAVSAAINGGYLYEPYIAKSWENPETGKVVNRTAPDMKQQVITEKTSKKVRNALESVVAKGTGRGAYVDGYRVGGKTGTAQKAKNGHYLKNNYVLSFMGFAPADDPEIVVYVAIDNPTTDVQFGGVVAAPIAGQIIGDSLRAMGVEPRKGGMDKERKPTDPITVKVPNLVGKKKSKLRNALYNLKIDTVGQGDYIIKQGPEPGVKLETGQTIRIYLGDKSQLDD
ncbi:stage V sporulation protein D [Tuberibacillus sp. Marseille-P3662]|uniref:stage V sporulation protein D n=1 Tax=Tuberibacillus sp. Marseille-P3662 TaxID=1965358 RepID=UPI000A1C7BAF|nr:stage V sporulation protein D [Tuberibacillus sp. Marseille-P3662]